MTSIKRIVLNILATYGRSIYALVVGLFATRWVLAGLGDVDFGLYGLIGGLMMFVSFLNGLMSLSVSRFYAVNVGVANKMVNSGLGLDLCRKWFNTAVFLHLVIPLILVLLGYPLGEWIVAHCLTIPENRVVACVWVWRFSCVSGFVAMLNVPFQAMYTAKQEIAELTIYSFVTTTLNAIFFFYMASHKSDWLVRYALWMCCTSIVPHIIIAVRAVFKYPECRFRFKYFWSTFRVLEIFRFAVARFWTAFSDVLLAQGQSLLVNKFLGPLFNASMRVSVSVSSQAATLSSSLMQAFWPAIANAAGEGNEETVRHMTFRACRFSTLLLLVFAIPLALESHEVLLLWLKTPPPSADLLCSVVLLCMVITHLTDGYWMAVMGVGRCVARYSWWIGWSGVLGFFITVALFLLGFGIGSVCYALIIGRLFTLSLRLYLGWNLVGLSPKYWLQHVGLPIILIVVITISVGIVPQLLWNESLGRVALTTVVCETFFLPLVWRFSLNSEERNFILNKVRCFRRRSKR